MFHTVQQDRLLATYAVPAPQGDVMAIAQKFATGQTVGTWLPVPGLSPKAQANHEGRVVSIVEVPPREIGPAPEDRYVLITIAFPWHNFGPSFAQLLTTLLGNDASTSVQAKLISLQLPPEFAEQFPGPRFGIDGVRERLGIFDRPIILNMIKPCLGFTPEVGARLFYETALGGVDLIKDDELLGDPDFCPVTDRCVAYQRAAQRVFEETGRKVGYLCNVSGPPKRMRDNALRAVEAGVTGLMVNFVWAGFDAVAELAADPDLNVPIFGHSAGAGALCEAVETGTDSLVLVGLLARLAGVDIVLYNTPYGGYPYAREKYVMMAERLKSSALPVKPSLPAVGGGVTPQLVPTLMRDLGSDILVAAGGSVQGHPQGARAGGTALRQAVDATLAGATLKEYAADHPELAAALAAWGDER